MSDLRDRLLARVKEAQAQAAEFTPSGLSMVSALLAQVEAQIEDHKPTSLGMPANLMACTGRGCIGRGVNAARCPVIAAWAEAFGVSA